MYHVLFHKNLSNYGRDHGLWNLIGTILLVNTTMKPQVEFELFLKQEVTQDKVLNILVPFSSPVFILLAK